MDDLRNFIRLLVDVIRTVAVLAEPFIPLTAASIQEQLGGDTVKKGAPLFPRIEIKKSG
jgi:methionyl-tRNA synthetase